MKFSFKNDYSEGGHPAILETLCSSNNWQQQGYGEDLFSKKAKELIQSQIGSSKAEIYFVSGGTQANTIVISSILRPFQGVIAATSSHILNNEAGAIEATGHQIIGIGTSDGKISPQDINSVLESHQNTPHQVQPKLVYISNSTELGTIYSKNEMEAISAFCKEKSLYLYMDGARLGHALMAENSDFSISELAHLVDVFYIGGTKNGALIGEAIVIMNPMLMPDFAFNIKQKGGLLAKGRLLGIQFFELFQNDLYFQLAHHANLQAMKLKNAFLQNGFTFLNDTYTNQIFPIIENEGIAFLNEEFDFYVWKKIDTHYSAIRLITSWNTSDRQINQFLSNLNKWVEIKNNRK